MWCGDVLVYHACDVDVVLIQSRTSCGAASFLSSSSLPWCASQGTDAMHYAREKGWGPEVEVRSDIDIVTVMRWCVALSARH